MPHVTRSHCLTCIVTIALCDVLRVAIALREAQQLPYVLLPLLYVGGEPVPYVTHSHCLNGYGR